MISPSSGSISFRGLAAAGPEPSPFVGRARELAEVHALVTTSRLVTVVGPDGMGKSRLVRRYALTRRADHPDGVWVCDLAHATDEAELVATVLRALDAAERAHAPDAASAITRVLSSRPRGLLVLDGLDHLVPDVVMLLCDWLRACPSLRVLATCTSPLGVLGPESERVLQLSAMCLPGPGAPDGEAVELFVERVRSTRRDYQPDVAERGRIGELVRRLQGVPLAIELAASRAGAREVHEILASVPTSLLPRAADADRAAQRAIDRGWGLLQAWERRALCQASVFRGGLSLEAAQQVIELDPGAPSVSEVLVGLAQQSLLEIERYDPLRFNMTESIRRHAAELLAESPDAIDAQWRHARYFSTLTDALVGADKRPPSPPPSAELARERDNLHAVMILAASSRRHDLVLRTAIALDVVSFGGGLTPSQLDRLDASLEAGAAIDLAWVARALGVRAAALQASGRLAEARQDARAALAMALELGDQRQAGAMYRAVAEASFQLGELSLSLENFQRALEVERERGDRSAMTAVLQRLGSVHQSLGETERARRHYDTALALAVEIGDGPGEARAAMGLGSYWLELGELDQARASYERGRQIARRFRMARSERIVSGYLGILCFEAGALSDAERYLHAAAEGSGRAGDLRVEGIFEGVRAAVLAASGRVEESRAAFDRAEQLLAHNRFFAKVIAVHRGHLDVAQARMSVGRGELEVARTRLLQARLRIEDASAPSSRPTDDGAARPLVDRSDDARIAVRILERVLERAEAEVEAAARPG